MNDQEKAEFLAEWLGWEKVRRADRDRRVVWLYRGKEMMVHEHWHPHTDIAQDFMLVEKMIAKGWSFHLEYSMDTPVGGWAWEAYFRRDNINSLICVGEAPARTIFEAVVEAANRSKTD